MSIARSRTVVALAALAWLAGPPRASRADEPNEGEAPTSREAAARFSAGLEAFARDDYPAARAAFEEAYQLAPDVRVLANIADCWAREGNPAQAIRVYRRFQAEAGDDVPTSARRLVERRVLELRAMVCDVRVAVQPAGAVVRIDGQEVGRAPLTEPLPVAAGPHTVEATADGYETRSQEVVARAGGDLEVSIALVPAATAQQASPVEPAPPDPPPRAPDGPSRGRGPLPWIGLVTTAALGIGAAVTGLLALQDQAEYEDPSTSPARRRALYDARETLPLVTDVLLDAAIVTGLVTAGLFLFSGGDEGAVEAPRAWAAPRLADRGGLACDLRWAF